MRRAVPLCLCLVLAAACADAGAERDALPADPLGQDPVIARALHDPLMTDPDLAARNEATALVALAPAQALPLFTATAAERREARAALRLELLEAGPIPDLPPAQGASGPAPLGPEAGPQALLAAVGAPRTCAARLEEDFARAAALPRAAAIPRLAMVVQAGGAEGGPCALRIVRYQIRAAPEDVLLYHYASARRAGLRAERKGAAGGIIAATGPGGERLAVHVREGAGGLAGALVVHLAR